MRKWNDKHPKDQTNYNKLMIKSVKNYFSHRRRRRCVRYNDKILLGSFADTWNKKTYSKSLDGSRPRRNNENICE